MTAQETLERTFQEHRPLLRSVARRILGSSADADDAVQETWLRLDRADAATITNHARWLSTVVARISLDMIRARTTRAAVGLPGGAVPPDSNQIAAPDPEHEALVLDSVADALGVVMHALPPAQRLAFVLHDSFSVPFAAIAAVLSCSPDAARQHASRARRRVRDGAIRQLVGSTRTDAAVLAFRAASRNGDFRPLVALCGQ